ncbi:MAG: hypothetical protein EHM55_19620 [Acidobacteria bacterium]|nr:MAG: hypothetical protein EHM55_19620 [Acidobacteriota bacterium]
MTKILRAVAVAACLGASASGQAPPAAQTWSGVISDSKCGASHQAIAAPGGMTERECAFHCLKGLARYVVVDEQQNVIPIANQDFAGIPLRLARPVRVTGILTDKGIVISRIELPVVHSHIGHVMIAWRDTPGTVGLLTVALSDTRVAAAHALLTSKSTSLDELKLHAGHVLHALDPAVEPKGPASGYGAKKATAGALQHVGFAAAVDTASAEVKSRAAVVSAGLTETNAAIDRALVVAQNIRAATSPADAAALARELPALTAEIGAGLDRAQQEMRLMMKAEGL